MGIQDDYKLFVTLKKNLVPVKEFDEKYSRRELDFTFEYSEEKEGRKVIGLTFEISKPPVQLELFDKDNAGENDSIDLDHEDLRAALINFKLTKKQITNLLKKYSVERIKSNIEVTEKNKI